MACYTWQKPSPSPSFFFLFFKLRIKSRVLCMLAEQSTSKILLALLLRGFSKWLQPGLCSPVRIWAVILSPLPPGQLGKQPVVHTPSTAHSLSCISVLVSFLLVLSDREVWGRSLHACLWAYLFLQPLGLLCACRCLNDKFDWRHFPGSRLTRSSQYLGWRYTMMYLIYYPESLAMLCTLPWKLPLI